jgi:hypothetical protein
MNTQPKVKKKEVALGLKWLSTPQLISNARLYLQKISGNVYFPAPSPSISEVSTQLNVLETAYTVSLSRAKGAVSEMHVERKSLEILLKGLGIYVETIANKDPDNAEQIINSSGMPIKRPNTHLPKTFTARLTGTPGEVKLNSKRVNQSSCYMYAITTNPASETAWEELTPSTNVKKYINGLIPSTRYYFRMRVSTSGVIGAWSEAIDVLVP